MVIRRWRELVRDGEVDGEDRDEEIGDREMEGVGVV